MARLFASASSEGLDWNTFSLPTAYPFTYSAWFYPTTTSIYAAILSVVDGGQISQYWAMMQFNDNTLAFLSRAGGSNNAFTSNTVNANAWNHGCCVGTSATRDVYLNGGTAGSNTTSSAPVGINAAAIGYMTDFTPGDYYNGYIGEVAVWNAALSPAEVKSLSKGYSPRLIRPQNLVGYVRLIRDEDVDLVNRSTFSVVGTPLIAPSHPPIIAPQRQQIFVPSAGGTTITASAIASAEAFGSSEVRAARSITGSGVASAEVFGTASINHNVAASAIASAEAFGTAMGKLNVAGSGVASAEEFGSSTVSAAGGAIQPAGIASAEAFGTGSLALSLFASAIASAEAFGAGQFNHNVAPSGIATAEAFGTQEVSVLAQVIAPEGIPPGNMGNPQISGGTATPAGGWILRMRRRRNR